MLSEFLAQFPVWTAPLTLAFGVVGAIIYIPLVMRIKAQRCRKCKTENLIEASQCQKCGESLPVPQTAPYWGVILLLIFLAASAFFFSFWSALPYPEPPVDKLAVAGGGVVLLVAVPLLGMWARNRRKNLRQRAVIYSRDFYGGFCGNCGAEILGGKTACPQCTQLVNVQNPNWTAQSKEGEKTIPVQIKVICRRCSTENPAASRKCEKCGKDLLFFKPWWERLVYFIVAILLSVGLGWLAYKAFQNPGLHELLSLFGFGAFALAVMAIIAPFYGIYIALGKGSLHDLLVDRAERHKTTYPWQALSDYSLGLLLSPPDRHQGLLKKRIDLYYSLGLVQNATRDELALTYAREKNPQGGVGLFLGEKLAGIAGPTDGFSQGFLSGVVKEARNKRAKMLKEGRVLALGYCTTCKEVMQLTGKLRCPHDGEAGARRHFGGPKFIQYIVPADLEAGRASIPRAMAAAKKIRLRRAWVAGLIIIGILALIYVVPLFLD